MRLQVARLVSPFIAEGGGAQAPRSVDSLVVKGSLPVQGFGGCAAGFAGAASTAKTTVPELRRASLYFLMFPVVFCKKSGFCNCVFLAKKKYSSVLVSAIVASEILNQTFPRLLHHLP
jgi:hypothetical protein